MLTMYDRSFMSKNLTGTLLASIGLLSELNTMYAPISLEPLSDQIRVLTASS